MLLYSRIYDCCAKEPKKKLMKGYGSFFCSSFFYKNNLGFK